MQILNLDILSFHLIPRKKLYTFEGTPKNGGFSAGLYVHPIETIIPIKSILVVLLYHVI
jgi:hypothetical protein